MNIPKVSIVITTYNRPQLLKRALISALNQTYKNREIHVVDDASDDDIHSIIENLPEKQDEIIHYWCHKERKGLAAARNTGIAKASGDYLAFLDDDDEWKPKCVEKRVAVLQAISLEERKKLGVIYCGCEIHILHEKCVTYSLPRIEGNIKENICTHNLYTIPSSCLFPKVVLEQIGGFDENLSSSIDHDIWMNLATHGYYAFAVKEPLVIAYEVKKRKSMVTDTKPRIHGVEQYLAKWMPTFNEWFGTKDGKRSIQYYRTNVLGNLASNKFSEGYFGETLYLIKHIVSRNHYSIWESAFLSWIIFRKILKMFIPIKIVYLIKRKPLYKIQK